MNDAVELKKLRFTASFQRAVCICGVSSSPTSLQIHSWWGEGPEMGIWAEAEPLLASSLTLEQLPRGGKKSLCR